MCVFFYTRVISKTTNTSHLTRCCVFLTRQIGNVCVKGVLKHTHSYNETRLRPKNQPMGFFLYTYVGLKTTYTSIFTSMCVYLLRPFGFVCVQGGFNHTFTYKETRWRKKFKNMRVFFNICVVQNNTHTSYFGSMCVFFRRQFPSVCVKACLKHTYTY